MSSSSTNSDSALAAICVTLSSSEASICQDICAGSNALRRVWPTAEEM